MYIGNWIVLLVGSYLLDKMNKMMTKENVSLYRDNIFGVFKNISGAEIERKREEIKKIFLKNVIFLPLQKPT